MRPELFEAECSCLSEQAVASGTELLGILCNEDFKDSMIDCDVGADNKRVDNSKKDHRVIVWVILYLP